jgi:enamine deaminase RidA (YjgF/YER057c/UK114 family)
MAPLLDEFLFWSAIVPDAPDGSMPAGLAALHQAFANLEAVMAASGGATADVSHVSVYLGSWDIHDDMGDTWVVTFLTRTAAQHARRSITRACPSSCTPTPCWAARGRTSRLRAWLTAIPSRWGR